MWRVHLQLIGNQWDTSKEKASNRLPRLLMTGSSLPSKMEGMFKLVCLKIKALGHAQESTARGPARGLLPRDEGRPFRATETPHREGEAMGLQRVAVVWVSTEGRQKNSALQYEILALLRPSLPNQSKVRKADATNWTGELLVKWTILDDLWVAAQVRRRWGRGSGMQNLRRHLFSGPEWVPS